jgi:hypothetical protein
MQSNTIKVFTPDQFLAAAQQADAEGKPLYTVSKKGGKDADKKYKGGTQFLNVKWHGLGGAAKSEGWFSLTNVPIQAIPDPSKKKPGTEDIKPQISATISSLGDFGRALMIAQKQWRPQIDALVAAKAIPNKKVHDLVQLTISENAAEKAGEPLDDPIFRGKIADRGDNFPAAYPVAILAGKPKTEIYDYRTGRVVDGKPVYELATVVDASGRTVPVDFTNIHLFVTKGSVMRYGRLMMSSVAVSQNWTSMQIMYTKLIIEPGSAAEFSDDGDSLPLPPQIAQSSSNTQSAVPATAQPTAQPTAPTSPQGGNNNNVQASVISQATAGDIVEALAGL